MKRYTFKLIIHEQDDEFWEEINEKESTGCDEVTEMVRGALFSIGIDPDYKFSNDKIILEKFEEIEE